MHAEQVFLCYQKMTSVYLTLKKKYINTWSDNHNLVVLYFITVVMSFRNILGHVIFLSTDPL